MYRTISCKCFLDVVCMFKFSTKRSNFPILLKLNLHLQKSYNSVMYLEFFAFYFIKKRFLCKFSIRKSNYYSSRVIYWWTHTKACFCIICWNTSSNLIWYCDIFLFKILVRNTVDNSSDFNVVPPSILF